MEFIQAYIDDVHRTLNELDWDRVRQIREVLGQAYREGSSLFICGNGGSAALASHIAVDLGKCASHPGRKRWTVMSLTDNVPWMTAVSNDLSYEAVFVEQLRNFARPGDVLLAISGSGNSPNVLRAVEHANQSGMITVGMSGFRGGRLAELVQHPLVIPAHHMGRIEDAHLIVSHTLVYYFIENPQAAVKEAAR